MSDKILIVGPAWVGDMVMAQTLFTTLKQLYPHKTIDVLAPEWSRALTSRMPEVSNSIALPFKHGQLSLKARYQLAKTLRAAEYTECYVLPNSFKSALIPFWAKIPKRIGWRGEWRYGFLNCVHHLDKSKYPLMIERFIALAYPPGTTLPKPLPTPALKIEAQARQAACQAYDLNTEQPILVLCPGAEFGPSKQWPADYYANCANHYLDKGWQVWILGSPKDQGVANTIAKQTQFRVKDLTGKTKLAEAIDLMSLASLVLTNDSGLMHIAAALNRPLVAMYGSTSTAFTPPLGEKVQVLQTDLPCRPCFKRECPLKHHQCMKNLVPEKVIAAANNA